MFGLALEGGGARGAYHIGVVKALYENSYSFDGFVGTSIGSINAAILAQGDFDKALELWRTISPKTLFDSDAATIINSREIKMTLNLLSNLKRSLKTVIVSGGVDTSKMKNFIGACINEDKLRKSGKDFALVAVSIYERKPYEMYLEDIPQNQLLNYIMASASFPGFKPEEIDGNHFIDGSVHNNCPFHMLQKKGYEEIIVIRTSSTDSFPKIKPSKSTIKLITPSKPLGNLLMFTQEEIRASMKMGYYDGLRFTNKLKGTNYYITPYKKNDYFYKTLSSISDNTIVTIAGLYNLKPMPVKRLLFEKIIPRTGKFLGLNPDFDYSDFIIRILEVVATDKHLENLKVYDFEEFFHEVKVKPLISSNEKHKLFPVILNNTGLNRNEVAVQLLATEILEKQGLGDENC